LILFVCLESLYHKKTDPDTEKKQERFRSCRFPFILCPSAAVPGALDPVPDIAQPAAGADLFQFFSGQFFPGLFFLFLIRV
jgi:hypothetical protein